MPHFLSTFLSYNTADEALVSAVAASLVRHGVITWHANNRNVPAGDRIQATLDKAIEAQASLVIFVSEASMASGWVANELATADRVFPAKDVGNRIIPVFLGDRAELVKGHAALAERWMDAELTQVEVQGIEPGGEPLAAQADDIAQRVIVSLRNAMDHDPDVAHDGDLVVHCEARASRSEGVPDDLPVDAETVAHLPALVLRPRPSGTGDSEVVGGDEWTQWAAAITGSISWLLGTSRRSDAPRTVHISGVGQLGLAWLLGHKLDRTGGCRLHCRDKNGNYDNDFQNHDWPRDLLSSDEPVGDSNASIGLAPWPEHDFECMGLMVGKPAHVTGARHYFKATNPALPLAYLDTQQLLDGNAFVSSSDDVRTITSALTDLLLRAKHQGCHTVYLAIDLPFAAVPLVAAHMTHAMDRIVLLEYNRSAPSQADQYTPLAMPL